jgi:hypothetical protein
MRLSDGLATRFCFDQIKTQKRATNQRFSVPRFLCGIPHRHREKELRNGDLRLLCDARAMLTSSLTPKTGLWERRAALRPSQQCDGCVAGKPNSSAKVQHCPPRRMPTLRLALPALPGRGSKPHRIIEGKVGSEWLRAWDSTPLIAARAASSRSWRGWRFCSG